jgi:GTPase SAR1 family protein
MKPIRIKEVMDLAYEARLKNQVFNVRLLGAAGVGKSAIVRSWSNDMKSKYPDFRFIDVRASLQEAPDWLGLVEIVTDEDGRKRTSHCLPDWWPTSGHGVILLEEVARANTSMMNCMMSLLQERSVGPHYILPDGWVVCALDNPESAEYDVNTLDTALRNRFVEFDIEYDHNSFVEYMASNSWCEYIQSFVKSGVWIYKEASALGKDGKYISPRTWEQLNAAHMANVLEDKQMHRIICQAILGKDIGNEFWRFVHDDSPVTAADIIKSKKKALKKLTEQSKPEAYQGDKISVTIESIVKNYCGLKPEDGKIDEATMIEVATIISSDQAVSLLKDIGLKYHSSEVSTYFTTLASKYPKLIDVLKSNIKLNKAAR